MREAATFCNLLVGSTSSTLKLSQWMNLRMDFSLHVYAGRVEETGKEAPQSPPARLPD